MAQKSLEKNGLRKIKVEVQRYNPHAENPTWVDVFEVPVNESSTVLEVLLYIYENLDSSLAFNYNCRAKNCGLCAMNVNGKPRLTCLTKVDGDLKISPLPGLPVVKDLIFDRTPFYLYLQKFKPYVVRDKAPETEPEKIVQPQEHTRLMNCRECFACMSQCPKYGHDDSFGGPLGFVKLAQLHYDVRDTVDRVSQANDMGIMECKDCLRCFCIAGIPLQKLVIRHFLGLVSGSVQ